MFDEVTVPDGFEECVSESEGEDVLYGFFTEVMIDPEDLFFCEHFAQELIEIMCALQVVAERFFDHDAGAGFVGADIEASEFLCDAWHELRGDGEVKDDVRMYAPFLFFLFYEVGDGAVCFSVFSIHLEVGDMLAKVFPVSILFSFSAGEFTDPFEEVIGIRFVSVRTTSYASDSELFWHPLV